MLPCHTILHPTDFSERSAQAFDLACSLAREANARLIVVHVAPNVAIAGELAPLPSQPTTVWRTVQEQLANLRPTDDCVRVEHHLCEGPPANEILRVAQDFDCDLIVMGTHGRSGLGRLMLGSVAEEVLRKAPCTVLLVKPAVAAVSSPAAAHRQTATV
jgi:nucleotide-binding universal stress UspA family protein